jgi:hypothetical protein
MLSTHEACMLRKHQSSYSSSTTAASTVASSAAYRLGTVPQHSLVVITCAFLCNSRVLHCRWRQLSSNKGRGSSAACDHAHRQRALTPAQAAERSWQ